MVAANVLAYQQRLVVTAGKLDVQFCNFKANPFHRPGSRHLPVGAGLT